MTDMRRVTISLPDDLDKKILEVRKEDEFSSCTYSEVVRIGLTRGLEKFSAEKSDGLKSA